MSKNIVPLVIVLAVIFVGSLGLFLVLNQKNQTQTSINLNPMPLPTHVIINKPEPTLSPAINMDDFQTMSDGLKIKDETVGSGAEVKTGDTITVNYLGTLENGTKFDSSYDRNTPLITQIGVGQVIKGWDEGILGMKIGGKRKLIIPSSLGYGAQGAGNLIPPNTTLVFEVELLGIK